MGWYGDSVASKWHSLWDDGYDFGDLFRSTLTPLTGPLTQGGKDIAEHISDDVNSPEFQDFVDEVGTGLRNTWYKYTGQAHLTDEYKHEEELANTVNQRTALDMMAAGLSKYGMSSSSAGSPSASNGLTLMDAIGKAQQVKAQALSLKEQKYNFQMSKKLGIRTGDKNAFAPVLAIAKSLFGLDLDDIPEEGLIPYVFNHISEWLSNGLGNSDGNGSTAGAVLDAGASAIQDVSKASSVADPRTLSDDKLDKALDSQGSSVGLSQSEMNSAVKKGLDNAGVNTTPSSFESNPSSYGVFSNDFKKDAKSFVQTMIDDNMVSTKTLDLLANQLSKRYNLTVEEVRKYLTDLVRELR